MQDVLQLQQVGQVQRAFRPLVLVGFILDLEQKGQDTAEGLKKRTTNTKTRSGESENQNSFIITQDLLKENVKSFIFSFYNLTKLGL